MKNLLTKELKLCLNPQVIIFLCFSCMVAIPAWPSAIAFLYPLAGLATIFPRCLADQDVTFTAMLPVRKGDVVKAKAYLFVFLEMATILLAIPFALVKDLVINPMTIASLDPSKDADSISYTLSTAPTFGTFGFVFLSFAIYNLILFPWYYHNPAKVNWPPAIAMLGASLFLALAMVLQSFVPALYSFDATGWLVQAVVLGAGIVIFALVSWLAERQAEKAFDKVDL